MGAKSAARIPAIENLREVLLAYMKAADVPEWPGTDGLTLRDILLCYPQAMAAGLVPGHMELLRKHPNLHEDLEAFFGDQ
jgi:hypothetical protein